MLRKRFHEISLCYFLLLHYEHSHLKIKNLIKNKKEEENRKDLDWQFTKKQRNVANVVMERKI